MSYRKRFDDRTFFGVGGRGLSGRMGASISERNDVPKGTGPAQRLEIFSG
jgi:hypothetical protein